MESYQTFVSGPWKGQCAHSWLPLFQNIEQWLNDNPGERIVHYPCRDVRRIHTARGTVYLKLIRALTDSGLERRELFSYLKWILRPSRALATWRISMAMERDGLSCPVPLLAARKRVNGYPTDIIITPEVPAADCWQAPPGNSPEEAARIIAQATAKLHQAGLAHGDFILRNLCQDPDTGIIAYLDNDRTQKPLPLLRRFRQKRNLEQMAYSFASKYADLTPARSFLACYAELTGWPTCKQQDAIVQKARLRYNLHRERPPI